MKRRENLLGVLRTIFKWKRQLIILCLIAGAGSAVISLILPVYYQATSVFLATSPDQTKPELLFGSGLFEPEYYGGAPDIDRILIIAESNELVNFMVDSFDLYDHYRIKKESTKAPYSVRLAFFDLYDVKKDKRDAIELSIEDRDREQAAKMARAAREKINQISQNLVKTSQLRTIRTYEASIAQKEQQLRWLSDTLVEIRKKFGVYNSEAQTESLTAQLSESQSKLTYTKGRLEASKQTQGVKRDTLIMLTTRLVGLEREVAQLQGRLDTLNSGIAQVSIIEKQYYESNDNLSKEKAKLKQYQAAYTADIPALLLVEEAEIPVVKSRPRRTLIVLAATVIAFVFGIFGVLMIENYKDVNWREIYYGR